MVSSGQSPRPSNHEGLPAIAIFRSLDTILNPVGKKTISAELHAELHAELARRYAEQQADDIMRRR